MELKPYRCGFVLAALLVGNSSIALADVLPPPPPPPPGVGPAPATPTNPKPDSGILEAPPPPPPGVNVEPPPKQPAETPAPTKTQPPPSTTTTVASPRAIEGVPPPPPPPDGVKVAPPAPAAQTPPPKPAPAQVQPRQTSDSEARAKALANYKTKEAPSNSHYGWYGWKSMIGLLPVYGAYLGATVGDEGALLLPAVLGGVLVTPIMHWTHGNKRRGWASFGLNIGVQMLGGLAAEEPEGAMVGLAIWNVLDIALLHHGDDPPPTKTARFPSSFLVVPDVRPEYKGLSVVGQF